MIIDEEDYLSHYGVKGMKWGKRKAKGPSTGDILSARKRVTEKFGRMQDLYIDAIENPQTRTSLTKNAQELKQLANELKKSGDVSVAGLSTKGQKITAAILGGPIGSMRLKRSGQAFQDEINEILDANLDLTPAELKKRTSF